MDMDTTLTLILSELKGMNQRMSSMEGKITSMDNRMDRLERGQDEIKSNLTDLTEQVKENTRFIRALVDGQTVLETKLSALDENFQQLSSRTKKLERTSGGILYELAIREDDLC